ncbi:MAG: hypothetical protein JW818_06785 [Pirellulales bacterium]|nr:hypothetical protein [Pirellulales bacterium]
MRFVLLCAVAGLLMAGVATAGNHCVAPNCCDKTEVCGAPDCCAKCGTGCCCHKTCKVVCEMKKVTKHVWVVECEEFCAPLPRCEKKCCHGCGCDEGCCGNEASCCGAEGCCGKDPCESLVNRHRVPPKCGKVRCKKKLVKKEITCEIPVYKCVVVYACPSCCEPSGCGEGQEQAPAAAPTTAAQPAPLPPVVQSISR